MDAKIFVYQNKVIVDSKNRSVLGFETIEELEEILNIILEKLKFKNMFTVKMNFYSENNDTYMYMSDNKVYQNECIENDNDCDLACVAEYLDVVEKSILSNGYKNVDIKLLLK